MNSIYVFPFGAQWALKDDIDTCFFATSDEALLDAASRLLAHRKARRAAEIVLQAQCGSWLEVTGLLRSLVAKPRRPRAPARQPGLAGHLQAAPPVHGLHRQARAD
jgi:hypothetical protein